MPKKTNNYTPDRAKYFSDPIRRQAARDRSKSWRGANPELSRIGKYFSTYGLTPEAFMLMYDEQEGCCAICGMEPSGDLRDRLYVDHDHATNRVRGLLCKNCNLMLGQGKDTPSILRAGADYLEGSK